MSERLCPMVLALALWLTGHSMDPVVASLLAISESRASRGDSMEASAHGASPTVAAESPGASEGAAPQAASDTLTMTTIRVVAQGLRHENGHVRVSLFALPEGFPEEGRSSLQWGFATLQGSQATFVFEPVEPGRYAVSVFHDEDGDGKMRKDWLGRPKEGWGVSRDAKGHFGPPSFGAAAFEAAGDTMTIHLQLRY